MSFLDCCYGDRPKENKAEDPKDTVVGVIGATGQAGSKIVAEALARGFTVVGITRRNDDDEDRAKNDRYSNRVGDVLKDDLSVLLNGIDVVVSAYSPGFAPDQVSALLEVTDRLINSITSKQRLITVGGAGSLTTPDGELLLKSLPDNYKPIAQAHYDALNKLRSSNIDWTVAIPAAELLGASQGGVRRGQYRHSAGQFIAPTESGQKNQISYDDLALAIVDEIQTPKYEKQGFGVAY